MLDNEAVVRALFSGYSPRPPLMAQIRAIRALCVKFHIVFRCRHIFGVPFNTLADMLSHDRWSEAECLAPSLFDTQLLRLQTTVSPSPILA
jgi:hypothetical protein